MRSTRHEIKVGLFVLCGLVLVASLLLLFSKGFTIEQVFTLRLKAGSAGILKQNAPVQMAGVPVGAIDHIELAPNGKQVTIFLKIKRRYQVHRDARFAIEQSGFLGDQYVSILPGENKLEELRDGDEVTAETPFDLQEVARSAAGFIRRIDDTAKRVNEIIDEIHAKALNEETLTNLAASVTTLNKFSSEALVAAGNVNASAIMLTNLLHDVQAGKGAAGRVIEDPQLAANLAETVANLNAVSSNLNRFGLWHLLWKKHAPLTNAPSAK